VASELTAPGIDETSPISEADRPASFDAPVDAPAPSSGPSDVGDADEASRSIRFDEPAPTPPVYNEAAASADDALASDAPEAIDESAVVEEPEVEVTLSPEPAEEPFVRDVIPPPPAEPVAQQPAAEPAPPQTSFVSRFEQVETRFPPPPADVPEEPLAPAGAVSAPVEQTPPQPAPDAIEPEPPKPAVPTQSEMVYEQVETRRDD
jgi:hypothetical protein